jgi:heptosyltransferase III
MLNYFLEKLFGLVIHGKWSLGGRPYDPAGIRRILVVRNDNVGDVLCSTPAIRALRKAFPRAYLAALVVGYSRDAITGNPDLDEVFVYEKAKHRPDRSRAVSFYKQFRVERELRRRGFDLAIGLRSNFSWSEAWLVYFTGAPFRLGAAPGERDRRFGFFYNLQAPLPPDRHEVEKALHLVGRLGVPPAEKHLAASIPEEEKRAAELFLAENRIDPRNLIGFHLSSRVAANRWEPARFAELAARLVREERKTVVLTWGPGDEKRAQEVLSGAGAGVFLFPTANFKRLGAIQQLCRAFVSPDGGAMHFAAAVGTPTIGLFGKTDPKLWAPWGDGHLALRKGRQADLIPVEDVFRAVKEIVKNEGTPVYGMNAEKISAEKGRESLGDAIIR